MQAPKFTEEQTLTHRLYAVVMGQGKKCQRTEEWWFMPVWFNQKQEDALLDTHSMSHAVIHKTALVKKRKEKNAIHAHESPR